jgi:shingomyelin synthase
MCVHFSPFKVTMSCVSLIVLFAFHKHRNVILRRTLFIIGCLYTLRTLSMLITQLPSGYKDNNQRCRPALPKSALNFSIYLLRTLEQTVHVGFQVRKQSSIKHLIPLKDNTKQMLCGDLLFSGHTLIMVMCIFNQLVNDLII